MLLWSGYCSGAPPDNNAITEGIAMKAFASRFLECCQSAPYCWRWSVANLDLGRRPLFPISLLQSIRFLSGKQRVAHEQFDSGGRYNGHPIIINKRSQTSLTYCYA